LQTCIWNFTRKRRIQFIDRVSLVSTIRTEGKTIGALLESMIKQTMSPTEIIIVDGGSSDGTTEIVRSYMDKLPIKLIISPDANIAKGRNVAIKNATCDIIAVTDGGCLLDEKWLENITKPIENSPEIDVVSGVYLPHCENEFEEIASHLIFPNVDNLNPKTFLPSGRSIAFRKKAWEKVDGYPEWLNTAEDTLFDFNLKKSGAKFALARDATVFWRVRNNLSGIYKQFYNYAKGDGSAHLFPLRYLLRYATFAFLALLLLIGLSNIYVWLFMFFFTISTLWFKHLRKVKMPSLKRILTATCIALAIEVGIFLGFMAGFLKNI
jgi:glycosyltransferase involved in cell wall biosynthesis